MAVRQKAPPPGTRATGRYTMKKLEQVRALAHPLRLRLFEAFATAPLTTRQVASLLGLAPTRLYHHVNALERAGLVRLRETRPVRGTIEKYFEAVGQRIEVEAGLFDPKRAGARKANAAVATAADAVAKLLDVARGELVDALEHATTTPANLRPVALRIALSTSPARLAVLRARVLELVQECQENSAKASRRRGSAAAQTRGSLTLVFTVEPAGLGAAGATVPRPTAARSRPGAARRSSLRRGPTPR